jgi:L-threonylcarbamoyladenylate synthase
VSSPILPIGSPGALALAAQALAAGRVVAIPTDTVYGIAARIDRPEALEALFAAKGRPSTRALPVLAASAGQARSLGQMDGMAMRLAEAFWPGALTIVVARMPGVDADLGGDPTTIGLRVPDLAGIRSLLEQTGPVATTSANRSGEPTPEGIQGVAAAFGDSVAVYLDGGTAGPSGASTVVSVADGSLTVLREGALELSVILTALGRG